MENQENISNANIRSDVSLSAKDEKEISSDMKSSANFLPFSLNYDGPCPVSKYFHVEESKDNDLSSSFRGRELRGRKVQLPSKIGGYAISRKTDNSREFLVSETFDEISLWEHDYQPNEAALMLDSLDYFDIAECVS
jgi:hypothetical protein